MEEKFLKEMLKEMIRIGKGIKELNKSMNELKKYLGINAQVIRSLTLENQQMRQDVREIKNKMEEIWPHSKE